ncbi:hypothetical protein ACFU6K_17435 [Kitasatospora sp. NPDC057512]|uniref:hypothetical protein n=1 Tax=Kitasatospora sp. NPDC057512 TaxID=3346154 RepID=UPI0036A7CC67
MMFVASRADPPGASVLGALRFTGRPGAVTLDLARSLLLWTLLSCLLDLRPSPLAPART